MYSIESKFSFEAAHRLYNVDTYSEECRDNLHGHSYNVNVKLSRMELNSAGMVMDFKLFKHIANDIFDRYDHACILRKCDPILPVLEQNCKKVIAVEESPTAEWMAKYFYEWLDERFKSQDKELILSEVSVQETENNIATYSREGMVIVK